MMALEEIAVADIRKGQKILVVYKLPGSVIDLTHSAVFESEGDELEKKWAADTKFYLLEDVPTPLFEVPWGTVQRDKDGDLWEFFKKVDRYGFVGHDHHRTRMYLNEAAEFAPFTRLYAVQELIDIVGDKNRGYNGGYVADYLGDIRDEGII